MANSAVLRRLVRKQSAMCTAAAFTVRCGTTVAAACSRGDDARARGLGDRVDRVECDAAPTCCCGSASLGGFADGRRRPGVRNCVPGVPTSVSLADCCRRMSCRRTISAHRSAVVMLLRLSALLWLLWLL